MSGTGVVGGSGHRLPGRQRIGTLFGGPSAEHEVSCSSALAVLRALPRDRFDPVVIGIDRAGGFVLVDDDQAEQLRRQRLAPLAIDDRLTVEGRGVQLRSRPAAPAVDVMAANGQGEQLATLDVVFPLMHGKC